MAPAAAPADAPSGSAFEARGGDGGTAATSLRNLEEVDVMRTPAIRSIPSNEEADSWQGSLDPSSTPSRRLKVRAGLQRDKSQSV